MAAQFPLRIFTRPPGFIKPSYLLYSGSEATGFLEILHTVYQMLYSARWRHQLTLQNLPPCLAAASQ